MDSAHDERLPKLGWIDLITRRCIEASVAPIIARIDLKPVFTLRTNSIKNVFNETVPDGFSARTVHMMKDYLN